MSLNLNVNQSLKYNLNRKMMMIQNQSNKYYCLVIIVKKLKDYMIRYFLKENI